MQKQVRPRWHTGSSTNGGNREKCILRAAISPSFPPSLPPNVLPHILLRGTVCFRYTCRKCAAQYVHQSKLRRPRRRPPFFPAICARIYGRTFVCQPQYMGDVIIVIRGGATTADWHWSARLSQRFRHLEQSKAFQKFSKLSCCCSGGKCSFSLVEKGKRCSCVNVLFPDRNSRSAARLAAFRQINKFPLFLAGSRLQSAMIMLMKPGLMSVIHSVIRQTINRRR